MYSQVYQVNDKLGRIIDYVENRYVDTVSRAKLEESAIPAILEELDNASLVEQRKLTIPFVKAHIHRGESG